MENSVSATFGLPNAESTYLKQIVSRLQQQLQGRLIGVYLFGSASYGSYEPGISDLDVQAVVGDRLGKNKCRELAARIAHGALPCPARKLEFVCYAQPAINPATRHPRFELNFNTGASLTDHLALDPAEEASHWFLLDIAQGREQGRSLFGPEPAAIFGAIPRLWQLEAIGDSLEWHREHELASANSVLNACRGWRYAVADQLGSKSAGAKWALQQPTCPAVVAQAEQHRRAGLPLNPTAVAELMAIISAAVEAAIRRERQHSVGQM
jgi:hypothetical protein